MFARKRRQGAGLQLRNEGALVGGDDLSVRSDQFPVQVTIRSTGKLVLGRRVFLNQGVNILAATLVEIGDDCKVGDLAAIRDSDTHAVDPSTPVTTAPVKIGNNVWIGRGALIMPGVTVGDHSVIAAGAIVTQDVPARSVAAGVPARVVRQFEAPDGWVRT